MSEVVLKAENISKQYRLGQLGTGTVSHDLNRWWHKVRGKEDPYLKVGDANDRSKAGGSDYVWSLKDINFEVKKGEVLGIIGKNGAGKSTLLKILSQVTTPTTGKVSVKGRIASLLEVGTGFHPDLTGRENIFLNGAILGMTKAEIKSKLDEIIEFSGVARYIDTPVKRYSSGMMVRLGFAVAAHLEPEILIVDEVLAVGDAEFQKKCLGKMKDVSGEGRTVLFVSHNMQAMKSLCTSALLLEKGTALTLGPTSEVISIYLNKYYSSRLSITGENQFYQDKFKINIFTLTPVGQKEIDVFTDLQVNLEFEIKKDIAVFNLSYHLYDEIGDVIFNIFSNPGPIKAGKHKSGFTIPGQLLNNGSYMLDVLAVEDASVAIYHLTEGLQFEVNDKRELKFWHGEWDGQIRPTFIKVTISSND